MLDKIFHMSQIKFLDLFILPKNLFSIPYQKKFEGKTIMIRENKGKHLHTIIHMQRGMIKNSPFVRLPLHLTESMRLSTCTKIQ